jgi:hypothetical protein
MTHMALEWELQVNGISRQKGTSGPLTIAPRQATLLRLPVRWPAGDTNEIYLRLRYRQITRPNRPPVSGHSTSPITQPGPVLAEEQLLVQTPAGNTLEVRPDGELTFTDVNDTFTILSPLIHIEFNKQTGWMQRYAANGAVLLTDTPVLKSNFWRPGAPGDTATAWQEASHDAHLQLFSTSTGNTMIIVRAEYTLPATSCLLHVSYTINANGEMLIGQQLEADSTQKGWPLPCFGMRWLLPADHDSIEYYGPGETNDSASLHDSKSADTAINDSTSPRDSVRLHAPWIGIYHYTVGQQPASPDSHQRNSAMIADIPEGYGRVGPWRSRPDEVLNAIRWIRIVGPGGSGLLLSADSTLLNAGVLQTAPSVVLYIDSRQAAATGIPGDNRQVSYGLPYGNYRCTYKISPISLHKATVTGHP